MARRRDALAAVNAGFFGTSGDPAGIFKLNGGATTRTEGEGVEWTLEGAPLRVTRIARATAASPSPSAIPRAGVVLSASGAIPPALARLKRGAAVSLSFTYDTALGTAPADWQGADDIVGGAGLLIWRGTEITDWAAERLQGAFVTTRHPRTIIGRDGEGDTWLVVIDGRQPGHSVGMTLTELTAFARRAAFVDALNLDGGGSTTMVVKGKIVNRPSDPIGPRPVSDAIVVLSR